MRETVRETVRDTVKEAVRETVRDRPCETAAPISRSRVQGLGLRVEG